MSKSFGIICYDKFSSKFLVIQRPYSPEFLHLMRGNFKKSDITHILENTYYGEHNILRDILNDTTNTVSDKIRLYLKTYDNISEKSIELIVSRSRDLILLYRDELIEAINEVYPSITLPWIWPKGRPDNGESDIDCAIRETLEETGYTFHLSGDEKIIKMTIDSFFGAKFKSVYYIVTIKGLKELKSGKIITPKEVKQVGWKSYRELFPLMSDNYRASLEKVKDLL